MATHNKEKCLPNVLTSISRQVTSFPFEVCIVDDYSRVDPEPIIREYLSPNIELKYKRLTRNLGGRFSKNLCLDMMDPEANVAVVTSSDVIYCQPNMLEELCLNVSEGIFTMPEILDLELPKEVHESFNRHMEKILKLWNRGKYEKATVYSGSRREAGEWVFFLGAIAVNDLIKLGYRKNSCDRIMNEKMRELGMKPKFLDHMKAIHQYHEWYRHPCQAIGTCKHTKLCKSKNIIKEHPMRILFYQKAPKLSSTMLTWTLGQELILRGHEVHFHTPTAAEIPKDYFDWIRVGSTEAPEGVKLARKVGVRVHVHLEGVGYWRIGIGSAKDDWGYKSDLTAAEIEKWKAYYRSWMSAAYDADSCSVNGMNQIQTIQNVLFNGRKLPNCYSLSCGVDARYALSIRDIPRENYMVTVSRLEPNKKVMMIARALTLLKHRDLPPWVIVGGGTDEQADEFLAFVKKHKIKTIAAKRFGAAKWMYIKQARLMLAGWQGIPPSEGLVCETPVLSFNHPDIVEMYSDSIWYAKDNDIESFAERLDKLLDMPEYALQEHVIAGKRQLLNGELYACTQEILAKKYEDIFTGKAEPYGNE